MEINPTGALLAFAIIALGILICAFMASELLLLMGLFRSQTPKPRVFLTILLFMVFSVSLYFYKCSGPSKSDVISTTSMTENCITIKKDKLAGSWVFWNVSHSKRDTLDLRNDGSLKWTERDYSDWYLFCDTLIVKNKKNASDSMKILNVTDTSLYFRTCSYFDTSWQFSAKKINDLK